MAAIISTTTNIAVIIMSKIVRELWTERKIRKGHRPSDWGDEVLWLMMSQNMRPVTFVISDSDRLFARLFAIEISYEQAERRNHHFELCIGQIREHAYECSL